MVVVEGTTGKTEKDRPSERAGKKTAVAATGLPARFPAAADDDDDQRARHETRAN